jgi:ankyrin repeat protein
VKLIKVMLVLMAMLAPSVAFAAADDENMEFITALGDGDVKVVQQYLDNGVNVNGSSFAWSPLQIAANKGQLEIIKMLVEHGADLNYKHPITKMTALGLAAYNGFPDVVQYLLSKGADPNIKLRGGVSIVRAVRDVGNTEMVDLLMKGGAKDDGCEGKCN